MGKAKENQKFSFSGLKWIFWGVSNSGWVRNWALKTWFLKPNKVEFENPNSRLLSQRAESSKLGFSLLSLVEKQKLKFDSSGLLVNFYNAAS